MSEPTAEQAETKRRLPTIWIVPDPLWNVIASVLATYDPPAPTGRERIDQRKAFDGVLFRMRTGCQWNQLPKGFGDDASVHRTFQRWEHKGVFDILWAILLTYCDELGGVDWQWQSAEGCLGKAPGIPQQPGDPDNPRAAKKGRKTNVLARTPLTAARRASRKACWSRATAVR